MATDRERSLVQIVVGAVALGALAGVCATLISQDCFHNVAGSATASVDSPRGPWCEAITDRSSWEAKFIGALALAGGLVHLLPIDQGARWVVWAISAALLIGVTVYIGSIDYTVTI